MKPIFILLLLLYILFSSLCLAQGNSIVQKKQLDGPSNQPQKSATSKNLASKNPEAASFDHPFAIAFDHKGNLFVGENGHDIRKITSSGQVTLFAGIDTPGYQDGPAKSARFNAIYGIIADTLNNLYVTDGNLVIRKIDTNGIVSTLAGSNHPGNADGTGSVARFAFPYGITIDPGQNLYVTDKINNNIRKITPLGLVTTIAGNGQSGYSDGNGLNASFNSPGGIGIDTLGNLFIADEQNHRIRKITPDGEVSTFAGNGVNESINGTGTAASFTGPSSVYVDSVDNVYVGDDYRVRKIDPKGSVTNIAGGLETGDIDGPGAKARFNYVSGLYVDHVGEVYVADPNNEKLRQICPAGLVSALAGTGQPGTTNGVVGELLTLDCPGGDGTTATVPKDTCQLRSIIVPNIFTPNGDGINELWDIHGLSFYKNCEILVYDRYGQMVFKNTGNTKAWDATYEGKRLPDGVYYYVIRNLCKLLSGYVTVLK